MPINVLGERAAFQVGTNQAGSWFRLSRLVAVASARSLGSGSGRELARFDSAGGGLQPC